MSDLVRNIKKKVEERGTPLEDWEIEIYRGVLTGNNKAFIISEEVRNMILDNCQDDEEKEIDRVDVYDSYVLNMELITGDPIVLQVFLQQKSDLEKAQEEIDAMAEKVIETVTTWKVGASYKKNDLVKKDSVLYMVLQDHTSQEDWPPETTYALYRKIRGDSPTPTVPEWVQPTGAHDAYNKGDLVMHKDKKLESMIDANVWEPGVYGWEAR